VLIGRLFDTKGRRVMIAFTYIVSGLLLGGTGWLFARSLISAEMQTSEFPEFNDLRVLPAYRLLNS
jgi:hypothetical protein